MIFDGRIRQSKMKRTRIRNFGSKNRIFSLTNTADVCQALLNLVVHHGGKEGAFFPSPEAVSAHLLSLIMESRKQVGFKHNFIKQLNDRTIFLPTGTYSIYKPESLWYNLLAVNNLYQTFN